MKTRSGSRIRLVAVAGARPNFMKIAPLLRELQARERFETFLVHTGQHYDPALSQDLFGELGIREPDLNLAVGSGSHAAMTAEVLRRMEPVLLQQRPDALLVVGDVNSTLAAALAAAKLGVPVAHVEAGLRSFDPGMPEEINRRLTDALSRWLFVTESAGEVNLRREGIPGDRIHRVGNVMIDTLRAKLARARQTGILGELGLEPGAYAVLTLHRPDNVDHGERLRALFGVLEQVHREIPVVFPVHPRTAAAMERELGGQMPRLQRTVPLGYLPFLGLLSQAKLVLTDSGGIQEETTALGVPCLTLRESTERPVTVSQGTNLIVGTDPATIHLEVRKILDGNGKPGRIPDLWDGRAAGRIVDVLERELRGD